MRANYPSIIIRTHYILMSVGPWYCVNHMFHVAVITTSVLGGFGITSKEARGNRSNLGLHNKMGDILVLVCASEPFESVTVIKGGTSKLEMKPSLGSNAKNNLWSGTASLTAPVDCLHNQSTFNLQSLTQQQLSTCFASDAEQCLRSQMSARYIFASEQ